MISAYSGQQRQRVRQTIKGRCIAARRECGKPVRGFALTGLGAIGVRMINAWVGVESAAWPVVERQQFPEDSRLFAPRGPLENVPSILQGQYVERLIRRDIALLHVVIGPIARERRVDEAAGIVFPAPCQEQRSLYAATHLLLIVGVAGRAQIGAHPDDVPEHRINATNQVSIAHLVTVNAHIAGDLTMWTLIVCQCCERLTESTHQAPFATGEGSQPATNPVTRPDPSEMVTTHWRSEKPSWGTASAQQIERTHVRLLNFVHRLIGWHNELPYFLRLTCL